MRKRRRMSRKANRKNFRSGTKIKSKNIFPGSFRGGIRL